MLSISAIFFCISLAVAENIPALIWSPSRPLSDLPQSYTGQTINTDNFQQSYLKPLVGDGKHTIVVFLQDKLSLEDFTTHADVYNPGSDGGAFKNIKSAMDDQYSVHLPLVTDPVVAIDNLLKDFTGELHKVDNSDDLQSLKLSGDKSNLILVKLLPTRGKPDAKAFTDNDHMMGRCMHHLNKRGVKYIAVYTAAASSQAKSEYAYVGRHLLADETPINNTCLFTAVPYGTNSSTAVFVYLCYVNVTVSDSKDKNLPQHSGTINGENLTVTVVNNTDGANATDHSYNMTVTMLLDSENMTVTIDMKLKKKWDEWSNVESTVNFTDKVNDTNSIFAPLGFDIAVTNKFCFHCTKLASKWNREVNGTKQINVALGSFQLDPFANNTGNETFTKNVWDCVGFFSPPIWMAIITSAVLMMILFFGLTMITNIQTMDRFDDPKGKTVTVTVNE